MLNFCSLLNYYCNDKRKSSKMFSNRLDMHCSVKVEVKVHRSFELNLYLLIETLKVVV